MNLNYFIGISLGNTESRASFCFGDGDCYPIALRVTKCYTDYALQTALLSDNDGSYSLVVGDEWLRFPSNIIRNFNSFNCNMPSDKRMALREFIKIFFNSIIEGVPELKFDSNSRKSNFSIGITVPDVWKMYNPLIHNQYLSFLKDEVGITTPIICIDESEAILTAINSICDKNEANNKVAIINFSDLTCDLFCYDNNRLMPNLLKGISFGLHTFVDKIIQVAYLDDQNLINLREVAQLRGQFGLSRSEMEEIIEKAVTHEFKHYISSSWNCFGFDVRYAELVPYYDNKRKIAFSIYLEKEQMDSIIQEVSASFIDYLKVLSTIFVNNRFYPSVIYLTGSPHMSLIVEKFVKRIFYNLEIIIPNKLERLVSDGAALITRSKYTLNKASSVSYISKNN